MLDVRAERRGVRLGLDQPKLRDELELVGERRLDVRQLALVVANVEQLARALLDIALLLVMRLDIVKRLDIVVLLLL